MNTELTVCGQELAKLHDKHDVMIREKEELMNKKKDISNQHTKQKTSNSMLKIKHSELEHLRKSSINCDLLKEQAAEKTLVGLG